MRTPNGKDRIIALLAETELFKTLSAGDRSAIAAKFHETRLTKGAMLFARSEPGTQLYIVSEGQVRLAISTDEGRELSFQIVGPGGLFGELAVLDGYSRSAEAMALTPTILYALERKDFHQLRISNPAISDAVVAFLCRRLRDVSDKLETIALYPLEVRLARFLVAALKGRTPTPGRRLPLELLFSQGELALLLGASRPKVNAALSALEAASAIGRTSDRLFCDPERLAAIAQIEEDA